MLKTVRIATLFLLLAGTAGEVSSASGPLNNEQSKILESVRTTALRYTYRLPDFICTQITHRQASPQSGMNAGTGISANQTNLGLPGANRSGLGGTNDEIEERLTYFGQKESYEVIAVDGKRVSGVDHLQFQGAITVGEFGSALRDIFDPRSHTDFRWERKSSLHGHSVYILRFRVPKEHGNIVIDRDQRKQIVVPYSGKLFVDTKSLEVLRLTSNLELPHDFPILSVESSVEYKPTSIAGKDYILPYRSEVRLKDMWDLYVNRIDFKNYQKFTTESTIHYDGDAK